MILECTVVQTTAETDSYTLKTPKNTVDGTRPWTLFVEAAATPDGQALPVDIWIGYEDNFALDGQGANVVAANGAMYKQILDDCVAAVTPQAYSFLIDPNLGEADVVTAAAITSGFKCCIPAMPYYAFNLDGGSTLAATTITWRIVQDG
jgi:hypothetical protein